MDADVVVVGTRAAGAATAMLLARNGLRVIAVDRAHFPSDTLSSHQLQLPGVACLNRWGLLDRMLATGLPPTREVTFDPGPATLRGPIGTYDGVDAMYSPRRTILDALLVDAAREAGAEVIEGFAVAGIVLEDGRVTGVRGRPRSSAVPAGRADHHGQPGDRSRRQALPGGRLGGRRQLPRGPRAGGRLLRLLVRPRPTDRGDVRADRRVVGMWPTHDNLAISFVSMPLADFPAYCAGPEDHLLASLDQAGDLGERARAATRVEPIRATSDLPHRFRTATGPGWALAGDAGLVMDPSTGQGLGNALLDAESLAAAVTDGLGGREPLEAALAAYGQRRDTDRLPMHEMTAGLASFAPRPGADELFRGLAASPEGTQRFFAVLGGIESPADFFTPENLAQLLA